MAHAYTLAGDRPGGGPGFTVAATAIPVGVLCRSCGQRHLTERLRPLAIRARADGGDELELRCARCSTAGTLVLDGNDPVHAALLAAWRDHGADDHTKAST